MINPIFQSDSYQLARKLLDASVLRQQAIAANIANAETPGYRRVDIANDFTSELKARVAAGGRSGSIDTVKPRLVEDLRATSVRPDGNSVEIERELVEMNRNTVDYEYMTDLVSRNIKQLKMAITGRSA